LTVDERRVLSGIYVSTSRLTTTTTYYYSPLVVIGQPSTTLVLLTMPRLVNLSDGRREIECAKQRLSAAKSNDASTSQNLTHAKLLAAQSKDTVS